MYKRQPDEVPPVEDLSIAEAKWGVEPKLADGSCLFHCLGDGLTGNTMVAQDLREVVALKFEADEGDIRSFLEDGQNWEAYVARVEIRNSGRRSQRSGCISTPTRTLSLYRD